MTRVPVWKNPRILSTLLFVFLAGALGGAVVMRTCYKPERHKLAPQWNEGGRELSLPKFKKELNLDPQQEAEFSQIVDDYMHYIQLLEGQMDDVRSTGKKRIMRILTEEQRKKFERMLAEAKPSR